MRAPYLSTPLGRDEGGIAYVASHWSLGHGSLYGAYWVDRPPLLIALFKVAGLGGEGGVRALGALAAVALVIGVALLARAVEGPRAGWIAGLLAALLSGSVSIGAIFTPGELLAAVPSTLSVLCLVLAHRSRRARFVFAAGALAVGAALIKQSFLDAGVAGVAFVAVSAALDRDVRLRWPLAYVAGAAIPLAALLVWLAAAGLTIGGFVYTLFGFRLDLLHTLAAFDIRSTTALQDLEAPAWDSGLLMALGGGRGGAPPPAWRPCPGGDVQRLVGGRHGRRPRRRELLRALPDRARAGQLCRRRGRDRRARPPIRLVVLGAFLVVALPTRQDGAVCGRPFDRRELAVGHYIRDHARPGDTDYVMYARPNVVYYAGLRHPYPYLWSLMVRVRPGARAQLQRLLGSPRRPTWLVQWQDARPLAA